MNISFTCRSVEDRHFLAAAEARGFNATAIIKLLDQAFEGLKRAVAAGLSYSDLLRFEQMTEPLSKSGVKLVKRIRILRDSKGEMVGAENYVLDPEPFWIRAARTFRDMSPAERFARQANAAINRARA